MDAAPYYSFGNTSPTRTNARLPRRASTQKEPRRVEDEDVVQGRIFWLPPKEELPSRAVRRAHGKGAVEEGIYNHPVVVVSRPADEEHTIHFHIITSFQGKRLHEIYSKPNDFHASRRSWYLPIAPSPPHPDANSKKTRKRFPTLDLAHGATLRWDSYVNLRHVYKLEWAHLRPYSNPDTPGCAAYRFERESMIKLFAKSKVLTNYDAGPQHVVPRKNHTPPLRIPAATRAHVSGGGDDGDDMRSPKSALSDASRRSSSAESVAALEGLSPLLPGESDFGIAWASEERCSTVPKKAPPDAEGRARSRWGVVRSVLWWVLAWARSVWARIRARRG